MRDILTALAGAVILILVAALAVPPFVAWEGQRALIDRTIARSLGLPARSEGRIAVRLLPSPRLRLDRLRLGDDPGRPALDLQFVKAEIALSPLLTGEVRFTETRIGRAEVKLPIDDGDAILVPADLSAGVSGRDLAIDDLRVQQLLLTTIASATGRTDQLRADDVRLAAPRLAGPWRMEGTAGGIPFRVATSVPDADGLGLKVSGGGDTHPRFEADARIVLTPTGAPFKDGLRPVIPEAEGSARLVVGPPAQVAGPYLPFSLSGKFKARGPVADIADVAAEVDPGGQALRLAGTGRLDLRAWQAGLTLGARRIDLDGFLLSAQGQALVARGTPRLGLALPVTVDLDLAVESVALGLDEWRDLSASAAFDRTGGIVLRRFAALAPGAAKLTASGEIGTDGPPRFTGQIALDAPASDGLGRYLRKFGLDGPAVAVMDGRPIQASADVSAAEPTLSLRNLRLGFGAARITGNARYTRGDDASRGRFDAQVAAQGIDIATLPTLGGALSGLRGHDLGLTLQARDVRYGPAGASSGNGTIAASIQSDGAALVVDSLQVTDLAGANARLSGRIDPDGAGRIAGRVSAPVAAPLLALLDRVWIAEARLLPAFVRAGALDLDVRLEREAGAADTLRTTAKGGAAGGTLELALLTRGGRIETLDLAIATAQAGQWFERGDIVALRQPADLRITGLRLPVADGGGARDLGFKLEGAVAGLRLATLKPIVLGPDQTPPRAGEVKAETADLAPFLSLAAGPVPGPLPASLTIGLSNAGADAQAEIAGNVAGAIVAAKLGRAPGGEISGSAALGRLSLPWIAASLVMPADPRASASGPAAGSWSSARFGPGPAPRPTVDLDLRVDALDLGRGFVANRTAFGLRLDDGALTLRDFSGDLAEGRLAGSLTLTRQGGAASI
ncbi:MAG TPA: AsmA family protein, partial [Methylobacterium sp.]